MVFLWVLCLSSICLGLWDSVIQLVHATEGVLDLDITRGHPDNYHRLHKCKNLEEVYAASWLITREHLLLQRTDYNLSRVNCELASFMV
jgi:hypothetical protein